MEHSEPSQMYVRQPSLCRDIEKQVAAFFGTRSSPVSLAPLTRRHLSLLRSESYVVASSGNGSRYLFLISKFAASRRPFAVCIDRSFNLYQVEIFAPSYVFNGSLFDGELVWDSRLNCMTFLIFDVIALGGKSVKHYNFLQRYEVINQHFISCSEWGPRHIRDYSIACEIAAALAEQKKIVAIPDKKKLLFIYSKPVVLFNLFGSLARSIKNSTHSGFIFIPVTCKQRRIFKWSYKHSINVLVENKPQCKYYCSSDGVHIELAHAFPEWTFIFEAMRDIELRKPLVSLSIKEAIDRPSAFVCTFRKFKLDKITPDSADTIRATIESMREMITLEELCSL